MAMKDELTKALATAGKEHEAAQKQYHKLLQAKADTEVELRAACEVASETANTLAALKVAVGKL